ncbi:ankyrin repeat domain-containing protein [Zeaxanthinibacter sp. PT1]|uniref:ankyrin repeat domain-containing protein n=1 Tax=Zeaxanthinibacter TaxID=561554 RepID=UPI00234B073A|nr:ankyrin repeat domain-containing protein [Zeaxanthinibacter sp. PT1]MDC6350943.1 ankyrin repeat domain-containing protein [Zeaxanthinibacter sp. PT1]
MNSQAIIESISRGRTDFIIRLFSIPGWTEILQQGRVKPLQWLVYYNDTTALRAVLQNGGTLESISLDEELGNAAFFGHWKVCDFLINQGADVNYKIPGTLETPLHCALCKAGRPYYLYTVQLLVEKGANVNAKTKAGVGTSAFMRDVRVKGETPLHRAAAYADENIINFLLHNGADRTIKDAHGNSALSWASEHLRPGKILSMLSYGDHKIGKGHLRNTSDHGQGWGNGMDWNLFGAYLPE